MSLYLSDDELKFLKLLAQWFEENRDLVGADEAMEAIGLRSDPQGWACFEVLVKKMAGLGAIKEVHAADDKYATDFTPSHYAVQLCRQIEEQKRKESPPDIVDQIQARFRRNPVVAWTVVILLALTALVTLANQAFELWSRLFK